MKTKELIQAAYEEDLPAGDVTTDGLDLEPYIISAKLVAKEDLVLSGSKVFTDCLLHIDESAEIKWLFNDGAIIIEGQTIAMMKADNIKLLRAERVALNFLGRLSGIATMTKYFVKQTAETKCKILDTRKTTPLLRHLEKQAVKHGGGFNHRMSLSDQVMIKDNHIQLKGSITSAVESVRKNGQPFIEVECKSLNQVKEAANLDVDRIMLDNMSNDEMRECLKHTKTIPTEASGNMNIERVKAVSQLGVDYISVGALTHSAPVADISLLTE